MKASRTVMLGAVASAGLLASMSAGFAQATPEPGGRMIAVPPGAVVLVLPAGMEPVGAFDMPDLPSPLAMIRQIDQQMDRMMADMQRGLATPAAAMSGEAGPVAGVVVTSFSNGHGTCTQRVTYKGDGSAPVVQIAATGDGCDGVSLPAATPGATPGIVPAGSTPAAPHVIQVRNGNHGPAAPLVYAQAQQ